MLTLLADNWHSGTAASAVVHIKLRRVESSSLAVRWRQHWRRWVWWRQYEQWGGTHWAQETTRSCSARCLIFCWAFQMIAFHLSWLCSAATSFVLSAQLNWRYISRWTCCVLHISHYSEYSLVELYSWPRCGMIYLFCIVWDTCTHYALNVFVLFAH